MMILMKIGNHKGLNWKWMVLITHLKYADSETSMKLSICFSSFLTFQKQMFISTYIEEECTFNSNFKLAYFLSHSSD